MADLPKDHPSKVSDQISPKSEPQTPATKNSARANNKTQKSRAKTSASPAKKRETLVSLRAHVDRVEARLKRANKLTHESIEAIESAYDALSHKSGMQSGTRQNEKHKSALDHHVKQLTQQLTGMIEHTRSSVSAELSKAITTPNIDQLKAALHLADDKITQTDAKLAHAISSINLNIADLARALDSQLKAHTLTQEKAVSDLRSETQNAQYALIQRLDRIEEESSQAFRAIGDKVASASQKIKQSTEIKSETLKTNLSQLIETSQKDYKSEVLKDFETFKHYLKQRLENLEADQLQAVKQRERAHASLETRLESLEFGLNTVTSSVEAIRSDENIDDASPHITRPFGTPDTIYPQIEAHATNKSVYGMDMSSENPKIGKVSYLNPESRSHNNEIKAQPAPAHIAVASKINTESISASGDYNYAETHSNTAQFEHDADSQDTLAQFAVETPPPPIAEPVISELTLQTHQALEQQTPAQNSYFGLSTDTQISTDLQQETDAQLQSNPYSTDFHETQSIVTEAAQQAHIQNTEFEQKPLKTQMAGQYTPGLAQAYDMTPAIPSSAGDINSHILPYIVSENNPSAHIPTEYVGGEVDLPYENPAYADPNYTAHSALQSSGQNSGYDPSMERARPGGFEKESKAQKTSILKLPTLSKQNTRTLGLAVGITAVSLIGIKLMTTHPSLSKTEKTPIIAAQTPQIGKSASSTQTPSPASIPSPTTVETIGNYADNKGISSGGTAAELTDLVSAAKSGNSIAEFQLGLSYLQNGRVDEALKYIRLASDSGLAAAQYRLAKLYEIGEGVTEDPVMARTLTERAARSGNRIAMHDLALYYAEGRGGVDLDMVTAAKWFEKAAERGVVDSQFNLGVLFESGQGLPQNLTSAFIWYSIAAKQGDQLAAQRIDVLSTQLSPELKTAANIRIKDFKPTLIDKDANGIFENLPWSTKSDKSAQNNQIKLAQDLLEDLGYDPGQADGAMGPRTRTAIMSFEKSNNLPQTGRVSAELIDRLSLAAGA